MDLAPVLDLTVLTVEVYDTEQPGIVAEVTDLIAERGISMRQTVSEDPEFAADPKLYIIVDGDVPGELINEIRRLTSVRKIEIE
jgi:predicted regulator of amino acid metabolism with ACT domain